jgi:hypothetical protein
MCDHQFSYAGVRYRNGNTSLPGSGATRRYYAHVYFCTKCTETRGEQIEDQGAYGRPNWNSYQKIEFGATPGSAKECGVPLEDARR